MKLIHNYWIPDNDDHFDDRIRRGGSSEYQYEIRDIAYKFVTDFSLAVDVGAHIGLFSRPFAQHFSRVIAYEPVFEICECLRRNVAGLAVDVHQHALGNKNGTVCMANNSNNTGNGYVGSGSGDIYMKRMDDLSLPKFGLLKVDCERYELYVLRGGVKTILKYKPIIIIEQHQDMEFSAGEFLKKRGARVLAKVSKDYVLGW